jgi:hypothetical protein
MVIRNEKKCENSKNSQENFQFQSLRGGQNLKLVFNEHQIKISIESKKI